MMEKNISVSVVIPAHNEENYIKRCITSVRRSAKRFGGRVEIIIVCNRCTDRTEELAKQLGAVVLHNEERCIAQVRNTGIQAAKGKVIVTMDCDNRMTESTLSEIWYWMKSGRFIGGGAPMRFERYSFPLWCNDLLCRFGFALTGCYCGIFWAERSVWNAIGGFSNLRAMEDVATARKLKQYARKRGKHYGCLKKNFLINSTRKFDDRGDWLYFRLAFRNAGAMVRAAFGDTRDMEQLIDELFYDYKPQKENQPCGCQ